MTKPLTAWSYSRFALYEQCPLKFKLEVLDGLKPPPSAAMKRGLEMHQGIANFLVGKSETLPEAAEKHRPFITEVRSFSDKLVEHQQSFTSHWQPTGWFDKDTWYRQVYDVAVLYEDMTSEVTDWKSGKKYTTNEAQMELCALSLMCQFKPTIHVTTRLFYIDTGQEEFAEFPASDRDKLKAKWEAKVAPMFADTVFAPRPNDKCRFCAFARSTGGQCRFG